MSSPQLPTKSLHVKRPEEHIAPDMSALFGALFLFPRKARGRELELHKTLSEDLPSWSV